MDKRQHQRAINAWAMYDWANSAFATTIMAAVLPVYYESVAGKYLTGNLPTVYWAYTTSISLLIAAVLGPILGAIADFRGSKKRFLTAFMLVGVAGTALLFFVRTGDWLLASLFFIVGELGFAGSLVFYDSLLPHIAKPEEIDQVSSRGYAFGYLGGGLLLAANLAMIMFAPDDLVELMTRLSFLSVAIWWFVFTIPLMLHVKEPPRYVQAQEEGTNTLLVGFKRLGRTFRDIRKYQQLFLFLVAFWLYNDGIGSVIKLSVIFGAEIGIPSTYLIGTLLMVQFVGIPFTFAFGWLAKRIGAKPAIYISLVIYTGICVLAYFMTETWQFFALGFLVSIVQGGSQALSRSMFSRFAPKSKSAEFFGFFSVSEKFAGIAGPFIFGLVGQMMGSSRLAIISLVVFFIAGAAVLSKVNEEEGVRVADAAEKMIQETVAA